jgi:cation:H+ antiporter
MLLQVLLFVLSFVVLYYGAEFALEAAEKVGRFFGLSNLVIGLLIVGFGTSLPELFVSQLASAKASNGIALGNIVGSNISNLFLIMGLAGLFVPLHLDGRDILEQSWFHIGITGMLIAVLSFSNLNLWSSMALFLFFAVYLYFTYRRMKHDQKKNGHERDPDIKISPLTFGKLIVGFAFLYVGGELLVNSGTFLGREFGVEEYIISAIFVAFGTSFPELMTALMACLRKKDVDLITGNIIGSNIFNVSFVMGSLGIYNIPLKQNFHMEFAVLIFASFFIKIIAWRQASFHRLAGGIFLLFYGGIVYFWLSRGSF